LIKRRIDLLAITETITRKIGQKALGYNSDRPKGLTLPPPRHCERARSGREAIQRYIKQGCSGTCEAWIAAPSATARNDGGVVFKSDRSTDLTLTRDRSTDLTLTRDRPKGLTRGRGLLLVENMLFAKRVVIIHKQLFAFMDDAQGLESPTSFHTQIGRLGMIDIDRKIHRVHPHG
jgi:hypothetical protein